jgi:heparin/heparan-sulfate lyase
MTIKLIRAVVVMIVLAWARTSAIAAGLVLEAQHAWIQPARTEIVAQESFRGQKGVALKRGVASGVDDAEAEPDLVFTVRAPRAGRYALTTYAATDALGSEQMRKAKSKFESLYARLQIDGRQSTRRVIFVPWANPQLCFQRLGTFELSGEPQKIRFWLPPGVRLDRLEIDPYRPPFVPKEAAGYRPDVVPPPSHPRLWVNSQTLSEVRSRLDHPDHQPQWRQVRALAKKPFLFVRQVGREAAYNTPLEQAAIAKAFCYLVRGDEKSGREAAQLMLAYLPNVEFGNLLDVTREVGAAIYAGALVYDWCYGLFTPAERATLRRHLMRLAEEMECGWPPFQQSIVNGHGNEAQICRDLLAMSIAIYDEDPQPYRYCAYCVLEQLVPMRRFEYQSPRHNQGVSYGAYRFGWEMHAAWLFRRMCGRELFDANIKTVPKYWLYMRLPDGEMLRDGDGVPAGSAYWGHPQTVLLCYAYNGDPVLKGEFIRQGGLRGNSLLFLLLDDPAIRAEPGLDSLPLTVDFGPVLGGMIARTGWNMGAASADVVAEIKGGGYHFGNHQHADAGSLQIYYRGLQAAKLAEYKFYGTPYDMNFAKRSVAQSMMLVVDPQEKILNGLANDGGSRFLQSNPRTPQQAASDATFHYGRVISCGFGPEPQRPAFSYFAADLRDAYSQKVAAYVRRFCFLNLMRPANPAAMIVLDDITASRPEYRKIWQLNTLKPPQTTPDGVRLWNTAGGATGRLDVRMLWPPRDGRTIEILSGAEANSVFGRAFTPPLPTAPEANGHRIIVSPKASQARDRFLAVMQACDAEPLSVEQEESDATVTVRIADRVVLLAKGTELLAAPFELTIPGDGRTMQVLCAGLAPGAWRIAAPGAADHDVVVQSGKNTLYFAASGGRYRISPQAGQGGR